MLEFAIFVIILLTLSLSITFHFASDWACRTRKEIEENGEEIVCGIKELRENLSGLNEIFRKIIKFQKLNITKYFTILFDIVNLLILFKPLKGKKMLIKSLFSIRFLRKACSVALKYIG